MTITKFLTSPEFGCATSGELIRFSQEDKAGFETLKQYAREEMRNRKIEIEELVKN
jgi:hypothetical protein